MSQYSSESPDSKELLSRILSEIEAFEKEQAEADTRDDRKLLSAYREKFGYLKGLIIGAGVASRSDSVSINKVRDRYRNAHINHRVQSQG